MNIPLGIAPLVSLIAGILILMSPRLLNYIVAKITKRPPKIYDQLFAIGAG